MERAKPASLNDSAGYAKKESEQLPLIASHPRIPTPTAALPDVIATPDLIRGKQSSPLIYIAFLDFFVATLLAMTPSEGLPYKLEQRLLKRSDPQDPVLLDHPRSNCQRPARARDRASM